MHILISATLDDAAAHEIADLVSAKLNEMGHAIARDIHGDTMVVTISDEVLEPNAPVDEPASEVPDIVAAAAQELEVTLATAPAGLPEEVPAPQEAPAPEEATELPKTLPDGHILSLSTTIPVHMSVDPSSAVSKLTTSRVQADETTGAVSFDFTGFTFNMMKVTSVDHSVVNPDHPLSSTTLRLVILLAGKQPVSCLIDVVQADEESNTLILGKDLESVVGDVGGVQGK